MTLLVALAVATAPLTLELCQMRCSGVDAHVATRATAQRPEHRCHEGSWTSGPASQMSGVHVCGHTDEIPSGSRSSAFSLAAPPPERAAILQRPLFVGIVFSTPPSPSPPELLGLTTQLRV